MPQSADFDAFYISTSRRVLGQLFAMLGSRAEAEDAVSEAYARAWQRWSTVSRYSDPEAWVRTIAYRISVSVWRKTRSRGSAHRRLGLPADVPGLTPDHVAVAAALQRISPEQRRAIVLHYLVGMSIDDISRETNAPINTVKSRLSRGRKALADKLSEFADEPRNMPERGIRSNA